MRRHRNTQQMKEQGKNPPDQKNEEEIGSLREKEFRVMIVKMIQNLGNRREETQERFNKDIEELKSKQTVMNNTINEIKNSLEGINSRITEAAERINDLEDRIVEITTAEQNKENRMKRIEDSLRDLWDNIKHTNFRIIGIPEEEEKKKGTDKIFEVGASLVAQWLRICLPMQETRVRALVWEDPTCRGATKPVRRSY